MITSDKNISPPRRAFKMQMQILEHIRKAAKMKRMHSWKQHEGARSWGDFS